MADDHELTTTPDAAPEHRADGEPARERSPFHLSWPVIVFIVLALIVAVASRIDLNYYAVEPGVAQSVQQFITVPPDKGHPVERPVLLTDVEIGRVSALSYVYYHVHLFGFHRETVLTPLLEITGGTPPSEFNGQGELEMSQAEAAAKAAALRRLGYTVTATAAGAVVFAVFDGTAAWGVLSVGDVVNAVDGTPVTTADDFDKVMGRYKDGDTVHLSVLRGGSGPVTSVPLTLSSHVLDIDGQRTTLSVGVETEDQVDYAYPFPVSIDVTNIGGPSAGLAMTLGVIDTLSGGHLTGPTLVACTGTIDDQGNVGDVGGVPQKTIAVERAGATVFLVPPQEYKAAMSEDIPSLHIYAVSTLDQALADIEAHGGSVPPQPSATSAG